MSDAKVFCHGCGSYISAASKFCAECGRPHIADAGRGNPTVNMGRVAPPSGPPPFPGYSAPPQAISQGPDQHTAYTPNQEIIPYTGPQALAHGFPAQPPVYYNTVNHQYQTQVGVAGTMPRDPMVAMLLELIGYFGFLGIGHIYAGRVGRGVALMIGWIAWWAASGVLSVILVGCCMMVVGLAFPILSGFWARSDIRQDNAMRGVRW